MRTETKAAITLTAGTNLRRTLLAGLAVITLASCGGGGGDDDAPSICNPPPRITSNPPIVATVGTQYRYTASSAYSCFFLFIPATCAGVDAVQVPAGASVTGSTTAWTPTVNQANTNVQFQIATDPDICGRRATQSWTVRVHAAPVIESFAAARAFVAPGESTTLTGVFEGNGQIEGFGPIASGVPVATPPLNTTTTFTLVVTNGAGARVQRTLTIGMLPIVITTIPVNGATGVPVNRVFTATFSKEMDRATITTDTFLLKDRNNNPVNGTVTYANEVATFAPTGPLGNLAPYTATISSGVKDLAGNPMIASYSWSFETGAPDTTPPLVIATSPANGALQVVPEGIRLLVTLSEEVDPRSVNSSTFVLKDGSQNAVTGTVRLTTEGKSVEFLPTTVLANSMSYTATMAMGIKDMAGNTMVADFSWTFMTEASRFGTWKAMSTVGAPSARRNHTAVWTGSEMIVWGGSSNATGARYDPATDSWQPMSTSGAPSARVDHTAVWTGSEMIVWGGSGTNTGGRYDPATDTWRPMTTSSAPSARVDHTAVWTGSEMIVWGGSNQQGLQNTGARYNAVTDTWLPISTTGAPSARYNHTAVWTGSAMLVWGGANNSMGGRYDPVTDSWQTMAISGAPPAGCCHTVVWTGSEMIVWGGSDRFNWFYMGGRYNPLTDAWRPTSIGAIPGRGGHTAVWSGSDMIIWGGYDGSYLGTGARYNLGNVWAPTSTTGAPFAREGHTAVWTGNEMIVWGGGNANGSLISGGRYRPYREVN